MANTSMQTIIPVSSSEDLQSLRTLDMIHGTSLRGRQEDDEISSGGIQSLLTLLPATPTLHKGLYNRATFKFCSAAAAKLASEKHQTYKQSTRKSKKGKILILIIWLFT